MAALIGKIMEQATKLNPVEYANEQQNTANNAVLVEMIKLDESLREIDQGSVDEQLTVLKKKTIVEAIQNMRFYQEQFEGSFPRIPDVSVDNMAKLAGKKK
jgi:hypothetical protein